MSCIEDIQANVATKDKLDEPLSNKDRKSLAKIRRKAYNLVCIKAVKSERIMEVCASMEGLDTGPERSFVLSSMTISVLP